jgi:hypothetical protein
MQPKLREPVHGGGINRCRTGPVQVLGVLERGGPKAGPSGLGRRASDGVSWPGIRGVRPLGWGWRASARVCDEFVAQHEPVEVLLSMALLSVRWRRLGPPRGWLVIGISL